MAQQPELDVLFFQRVAKQGVIAQVDHAGCQVIARSPIGVNLLEFF